MTTLVGRESTTLTITHERFQNEQLATQYPSKEENGNGVWK